MARKIIGALLLVLLALSFYGCSRNEIQLSPQVREKVDRITENCLLGLAQGDYGRFSKDFSDQMLQSITEENFKQSLSVQLNQTIGIYQEGSKEYIRASGEGENISLYYQAGFSEDEVLVTVVLDIEDEDYQITGLWFDSPKLRK